MKQTQAKAIIQDCLARGWQKHGDRLYTPQQVQSLDIRPEKRKRSPTGLKTGNTDDYRNIRNKAKYHDQFIQIIKIELKLTAWPEYFFTTERNWRFDYAIPQLKIAVEVNGGIWAKGASGHSSGTGIKRDMEKATAANIAGWTLIQVQPNQLITSYTIDLIKKAYANHKNIQNG